MNELLYNAYDILAAFMLGAIFLWAALVVVDEIHKHLP